MLAWTIDTLGGIFELLRLGVLTRFRFRGEYWRWRLHTAFGAAGPGSCREGFAAIMDYGRWVYRIRRTRSHAGQRGSR